MLFTRMQSNLMKKILNTIFAVLMLSISTSTQALAQEQNKTINKTQAAQKAQQQYKGKVLKVDQKKTNIGSRYSKSQVA